MNALQLLLVTGLLIVVLLLVERISRPPETLQQFIRRLTLHTQNMAVAIGTQLIPATEKATRAFEDFQTILDRIADSIASVGGDSQ